MENMITELISYTTHICDEDSEFAFEQLSSSYNKGGTLHDLFSKLSFEISAHTERSLQIFVRNFETRHEGKLRHGDALNGVSLGMFKIVFKESDRQELFDIFNVDEKEMKAMIKSNTYVQSNWKVASDAFNMLAVYAIFRILTDKHIPKNKQVGMAFNVAKILNYKFFTSILNHYFDTAAPSPGVMQATIERLSKKFDIIQYGTWKNVIEAKSMNLVSNDSIHYKTLRSFSDDKGVVYVITDVQTRTRKVIQNVYAVLREVSESGQAIASYSNVMDIDGTKMVVNTVDVFESMTTNVCREVLDRRSFIDLKAITVMSAAYKGNLTQNLLMNALTAMNTLASDQARSSELHEVKEIDGVKIYTGIHGLIENIIQKSYRHCMRNKTNIGSKGEIFTSVRNIYSAPKIKSEELRSVKASVGYFVDELGETRREATKAALRVAIILYIILRSFKYN